MDRYQLTNEHRAIKTPDGKWCKWKDVKDLEAELKHLKEYLRQKSRPLCDFREKAEKGE